MRDTTLNAYGERFGVGKPNTHLERIFAGIRLWMILWANATQTEPTELEGPGLDRAIDTRLGSQNPGSQQTPHRNP